MTSAADLLSLQEIDLKRDTRRALIADIEGRIGETEDVISARQEFAQSESELAALRTKQKHLDDQLADIDARIKPIEKRLYDGSVRNPKELTDLQRELDGLKARRSRLDDEGLSLIESVEAATTLLRQRKEALTAAEEAWRRDQRDLLDERERAEHEVSLLQSERERWTARMDTASLDLYESLRRARQGRAVARIERGSCGGCHLTLPTHVAQRVRTGTELVQCPSCERILVGV